MKKQSGEILRRKAWQTLDLLHGGKQQKLKEVNKREILDGVTPAYINRRLGAIMDYAAETCLFYRERFQGVLKADDTLRLEDFPVLTKGDFLENYEGILSDVFRDQRDSLHRFSTSGSTGTPFTVLADDD
ncbi:MAG: phenylacetate--CoA ligase family protein, partial [Lachnospiraceae bacterium]|nr:phenylacetate--CoA ligase family protein [Lachnospiraceae bacterium]